VRENAGLHSHPDVCCSRPDAQLAEGLLVRTARVRTPSGRRGSFGDPFPTDINPHKQGSSITAGRRVLTLPDAV
jgi:hypothetical protein